MVFAVIWVGAGLEPCFYEAQPFANGPILNFNRKLGVFLAEFVYFAEQSRGQRMARRFK